MRIVDHWLSDPPDGVSLRRNPGTPSRGAFSPTIAVVHYAVTDSIDATYRAMHSQGFFAHVTIDACAGLNPAVEQHLPFNARGAHAGKSSYQGRASVNGFGIGIEIANPGPLTLDSGGTYRTVYGQCWEGPVYHGRHRNPNCRYEHWCAFTDEEVDLVTQLVELWRQVYGITDVVGHDEIAPGRKIDPGPAFPIEQVREAVFLRR